MAVLRFLASLFLLVAVVAFVADVTGPLTGAAPFAATSLGRHWQEFAPSTYVAAREAISKGPAPWAWSIVVSSIIAVPTFILFAALGLVAGYAGRRRRRINIYVN